MDRRTLIKRIAVAAGAAYWSGQTLAVELAQAAAARPDAPGPAAAPLPAPVLATLAAVCELIIPTTATPGAIKAGVPAFIADMRAHWMTATERLTVDTGLAGLDTAAWRQHGKPFAGCTAAQQTALFAATHAAASSYQSRSFGGRIADPAAPFFYKMRDLVTLGYFTSEPGVSSELAYVPVPGRWDADVDVKTWNRQIQI